MLAGPIVKLVLLLLVVFSVVSWAIIFLKFRLLKGIERNQAGFARAFAEGKSLSALYEQAEKGEKSPLTEVFRAGYIELTRIQRERGENTQGGRPASFPVDNVSRAMYKTTHEQIGGMEDLLPFLATTGSATPFIGLFGTVWGIMNAFSGIATTGNATLATVAPGIAEALVATAAGLAAAIPSVMAYNYFLTRIRTVHTRIDSFTAEFINFLERKVEKG
ncbi:MAG: protein TolQ [Deltaproteobacteria bacterium RBG_16_66_15]|nr:MAG: protein TolQ [Deltaproteobacteria bacterium GWA2_65_63]OGP27977.1 MAG: protein TolQ [Deltaproteobacteria bacterium GWB2_65_81]OGP37067.1 MAG: protein TolQ [Deltaproteobacteria bacterium GWC2_66_88]OGP77591.1 MAG: protein TolQ [Deltaproteobacteria bacterium RBG_16_66_15]HAM32957.1 protein TolQ [Deltaproteobacteria bacterium]